jgi:hypothetical protein
MLNYKSINRKILNKRYLPLLSLVLLPAFISISLSDSISFSDSVNTEQRAYIYGHLVLEVKDQFGNTKYYSQGDNVVVNNGENCASKLLFQAVTGAAGSTVCAGANTVGFRYIGLEESATAVAEDDTGLNDPADSAGLSTPLFGSATWTNSTGTGGSSNAIVAIAATFTNSGASETIQGAGLFNSTTTTQGMFAHKLAAAPATVDTTNTLTATWTITIGGT